MCKVMYKSFAYYKEELLHFIEKLPTNTNMTKLHAHGNVRM
jgi:hypothetical protein